MLGNRIRTFIRFPIFGIITILSFVVALINAYIGGKNKVARGFRIRKHWSKYTTAVLGYKIEFKNRPPEGSPYLFVSNHRSSLDPLFHLSDLETSIISKADVSSYPLMGKGGAATGVIFVIKTDRSSRHATKKAIYDTLKAGNNVFIYPEGKTTAEPLTATFQKGAYEQAAALNIPVIPIATEYKSKNDYWDHTDSMYVHYIKNLAKSRTRVKVIYGDPIQSNNAWTLLRASQEWINEKIKVLRSEFDNE